MDAKKRRGAAGAPAPVEAPTAPVETVEEQGVRMAGKLVVRVGAIPTPAVGGEVMQQ
ncbi:hypothetical protein GCM10023081_32640 [Arthrobacter ginkgonis]|uniref:Uncharacterized protein n=1 Tax=Arthrobacter ginkgonis TaxID=1630594 RepID=A0ABP7CQ07_9MICC